MAPLRETVVRIKPQSDFNQPLAPNELAPTSREPAALVAVEGRMDDLGFWIEEGGWGMRLLLLCSVFTVALVLERAVMLVRTRGPSRALTDAIEVRLRAGDLADALSLAMTTRGACARVAARILREALGPPARAEAAREEALANERPPLERNVSWLAALAGLATLSGLFGTVTGLDLGFGTVSPDATSRAVMLANAMSKAMNCTAGGLLITLVALVGYFALRGAVSARLTALGAESQAIVNMLVTYRARIRWLDRRPPVESFGYRR